MVSQPVIQGYLLILLVFSSSIILLQINYKLKIIILNDHHPQIVFALVCLLAFTIFRDTSNLQSANRHYQS